MLTNIHNLPEEVVTCLTRNRYDADDGGDLKTDYSISQLYKAPREVILRKRHPEHSQGDVIDRVYSLQGSVAHELLHEHKSKDAITEKRVYTKILNRIISGQTDHYKDGIITDYKFTSVWKYMSGDFTEYTQQLNSYAYLFHTALNKPVTGIRIIAFLVKDWSIHDLHKEGYPQKQIEVIDLPLWTFSETESFLKEKVRLLIDNEIKSDEDLDHCTKKDMWATPDIWACMGEGSKRSSKNCLSEEEAKEFVAKAKKPYTIEFRKGVNNKCIRYCSVSEICNQYQQSKPIF